MQAFTHIDCKNDQATSVEAARAEAGQQGMAAQRGISATSEEHAREHVARKGGGGFKGLGKLDIRELEAWLNTPASRKDVPLKSEDR